jgi:hypothetical protein
MTWICYRAPCGRHSGGCTFADCPANTQHNYTISVPSMMPAPAAPMGCICPPTSEKTCENPSCPRKNPFKHPTNPSPPTA